MWVVLLVCVQPPADRRADEAGAVGTMEGFVQGASRGAGTERAKGGRRSRDWRGVLTANVLETSAFCTACSLDSSRDHPQVDRFSSTAVS